MLEMPDKLSRDFWTNEFIITSTGYITIKHLENLLVYYIPVLQGIRDFYSDKYGEEKVSIEITSFIRGRQENEKARGAKNSAHINSNVGAVDAIIHLPEGKEVDHRELFALIVKLSPRIRCGVYVNIKGRPDFHIDAGYILGLYPEWKEIVHEDD